MKQTLKTIGIWAFWIVVVYLIWCVFAAYVVECRDVGIYGRSIEGGSCI